VQSVSSVAVMPSSIHARERAGVLLCVSAAASYGVGVVLAKLAYGAGAGVLPLLVLRFAIATSVLWVLAARRGIAHPPRRDALAALVLGFVFYATDTGLMYAALTRIDAALVELLLFTFPGFVMLAGVLLKRESPSRRRVGALGLAFAGVALVLGGGVGGSLDALGIAMPLGAAVVYAIYVLRTESLAGRLDPIRLSALVTTGVTGAFVAAGVGSGALDFDMPAAAWGWTLALALGGTILPVTAFAAGIARIGPGRASILAMIEPLVVIAGASLVLGESLGPLQLAGGALVLGGATLVQLRPRRRAARTAERDNRVDGPAALAPAPAPARALAG
jgi:drug/metabolite transporter (DMT)-like permease